MIYILKNINEMNNDVLISIGKWIPYYLDKLCLYRVNKYMYFTHEKNRDNILDECKILSLQYYDLTKHAGFARQHFYANMIKYVLHTHISLIPSKELIEKHNSVDDFYATGKQYTIQNLFTNTSSVNKSERIYLLFLQRILSHNYGWTLKTDKNQLTCNFMKDSLSKHDILYICPY